MVSDPCCYYILLDFSNHAGTLERDSMPAPELDGDGNGGAVDASDPLEGVESHSPLLGGGSEDDDDKDRDEQVAPISERLFWRVALHVVPPLWLGYALNIIDRVNLGYAQLQMAHDLHLSPRAFGCALHSLCSLGSEALLMLCWSPPAQTHRASFS